IDPHLGLHVSTTLRTARRATAAFAEEVAQHVPQAAEARCLGTLATTEEVVEVEASHGSTTGLAETTLTEATGAAAGEHVPRLVVLLALLRIGQHPVGFGNGLELVLRRVVAGIGVRVVVPGEFAIGLLDLVLRSVGGDAQLTIEVLVDPLPCAHRMSPPLARIPSLTRFVVEGKFPLGGWVDRRLHGLLRRRGPCGAGGLRRVALVVGDRDHRVPQYPLTE